MVFQFGASRTIESVSSAIALKSASRQEQFLQGLFLILLFQQLFNQPKQKELLIHPHNIQCGMWEIRTPDLMRVKHAL
jgi:hypothetical protein